ncbi:MAG: sugar phosphate isomerase/epimerase family protein [Pseudomonadota bacterium]
MVKIGVHLALWTRDWSDDILPYAERAKAIGYDGVEISLLGNVAEAPEATGEAIRAMGLQATCTTGLGPPTDLASDDPAIRAAGVDALRSAIDVTARLGSRQLCGVIYGAWGVVAPGKRTDRVAWARDGLAAVAGDAEAVNVKLGVEAINRYETDLVNTAGQATELCKEIGSSHVGVLLDTYHMNIEEVIPADAIKQTGQWLCHFHATDNDRGAPGGGLIDFAAQAKALDEIGYEGWITTEMFILPDVNVSGDLSTWRAIEPGPDEAAKAALTHLRSVFG